MMTNTSKFVLLNDDGEPQFEDYITVVKLPRNGRDGKVLYHDESGSVDELKFKVVSRDADRIVTRARHVKSGQRFQFEIVYGPSGVTEFWMHCGENDIAYFKRDDLCPREEEVSDDGVYVSDDIEIVCF
jgi:hypothetical protein